MTTTVFAAPRDPLAANPTVAFLAPRNDQYRIHIIDASVGSNVQEDLHLSRNDLGKISRDLLQRWQEEIGRESSDSYALQRSLHQSQNDLENQLVEFASAGNRALREILKGFDSGQVTGSYFASLLAKLLSRDAPEMSLAVISDLSPPLPWRMLYADPDAFDREITFDESPANIKPNGFFGLAGMIGEAPGSIPGQAAAGTTVPIGVYQGMRTSAGGVQDVQAIFAGNNGFEVLDAMNKKDLRRYLRGDSAALIYLFCHGKFRPVTGGEPMQLLAIQRNEEFSAGYLQLKQLTTQPIAFINACQGGVYGGTYDDDFVTELSKNGASGTLAPLVDMPVRFGGPFGTAVLHMLADGSTLAEACLEASRKMYREQNNLLGLAYSSTNGFSSRLSQRR